MNKWPGRHHQGFVSFCSRQLMICTLPQNQHRRERRHQPLGGDWDRQERRRTGPPRRDQPAARSAVQTAMSMMVVVVACLGDSHLARNHLPLPVPHEWLACSFMLQWLRRSGEEVCYVSRNQLSSSLPRTRSCSIAYISSYTFPFA